MARFDVYPNPYTPERSHTPFVLDVQNDHLAPLATRVVVPLRTPKGFGAPMRNLNPTIEIEGQSLIVDTAALAPVPASMLRKPAARAEASRADILDALDALFGAY